MAEYYYSRLDDSRKEIYNALLSGLNAYDKEIKVKSSAPDEITAICNHILFDNPLIFYVTEFRQMFGMFGCTIMPVYKFDKKFSEEKTAAVKDYLRVFDSLKNKSDLEKEMQIHDYCVENFSYDFSFGKYSRCVLGPVTEKTAVCEGIAKFVKLACDYTGLKCLVAAGNASNPVQPGKMEPHAWNIVKIDGKTYHLDVTYDMSVNKWSKRYDYFNLSDEDIKIDHAATGSVPACAASGNDYYSVNSMVANSPSELESYMEKMLKQGKKNIIVKVRNVKNTENIGAKVMEIAQKQYVKVIKGAYRVDAAYNPFQMVIELNFS
jgi:hypothetical protein